MVNNGLPKLKVILDHFISKIMIDNYKKLKNIKIRNKTPKAFFPKPNEFNYQKGFIERYFIQMRATPGSPIIEINADTYYQYQSDIYYSVVGIKWKITGELEDKYTENGEYVPSVHTVNSLIIKEAEKVLPELNLYLVNTKQFHRLV